MAGMAVGLGDEADLMVAEALSTMVLVAMTEAKGEVVVVTERMGVVGVVDLAVLVV